ncbi:hypothetical protein U1Q18_000552 [Sarracenia purpurea var. burkii]
MVDFRLWAQGATAVARAEEDGEQVAASGWAINVAMVGLKMRRQRGAHGERNQISSPSRGETAVARAEEDGKQVAASGWAIDGAMVGLKMRR